MYLDVPINRMDEKNNIFKSYQSNTYCNMFHYSKKRFNIKRYAPTYFSFQDFSVGNLDTSVDNALNVKGTQELSSLIVFKWKVSSTLVLLCVTENL